jgi:hypothetical protein
MLPDKEVNSNQNSAESLDQDPYVVSLVSQTRPSARSQSENIRTVLDEMQGTALRRRTQLLNSGH